MTTIAPLLRRLTGARTLTAACVIVAMFLNTVPISAEAASETVADVRGTVAAFRKVPNVVCIELMDGTRIKGSIGAIQATRFYLEHRPVKYKDVAAFLDPVTGSTVLFVQTTSASSLGPQTRRVLVATIVVTGIVLTVTFWDGWLSPRL